MARCDRRRHPHSDSWATTSLAAQTVPSSDIKSSGTPRHRFTQAGTYGYVCTLRVEAGMTGQVIVR